ncbi:hypothetical protein FP435_04805 [Lactobacillus sp. PV037]|uniref:hypothetical protein n=1 Tax=Lactobacillus sp. PV037 TaxID=2594496 RepID=UPI00223FDAD8|nr:hypothetical protein [Lactobacillus sp. PV037]QNQ83811.1 hypothetical protein FP435_04805 [Lactobacillus sp. PV037]
MDPKEFPFIIAHELGHTMLYRGNLPHDNKNGNDSFADRYALRFIFEYYQTYDKETLDYKGFITKYHIPDRVSKLAEHLFKMKAK